MRRATLARLARHVLAGELPVSGVDWAASLTRRNGFVDAPAVSAGRRSVATERDAARCAWLAGGQWFT